MICQENSEFVSALFDGEPIPSEAAAHIYKCQSCRSQLNEYARMTAELRLSASLEAPRALPSVAWNQQRRNSSGWWTKGWNSMRIPKLAFVLMLVAIVGLGSGVAVLRARTANPGQTLLLTILTGPDLQPQQCPILLRDTSGASCAFMRGTPSGVVEASFRIVEMDGNRFQLGIRSGLVPPPPHAPNKGYQISLGREEIEKLPETQYWFETGQKLTIETPSIGTMIITGELRDHMPSMASMLPASSLEPNEGELRMFSPTLLRGSEKLLDFGGVYTSAERGMVVSMYGPCCGRYVVSLLPLPGAVEGEVEGSRIRFEISGQRYEFLTGAPIATTDHVWIVYQPSYKPSMDTIGPPDEKPQMGKIDPSWLHLQNPPPQQ